MCGKEEDRWLSLITRGMTTLTRAKRTSRIVSFLMVFGISTALDEFHFSMEAFGDAIVFGEAPDGSERLTP